MSTLWEFTNLLGRQGLKINQFREKKTETAYCQVLSWLQSSAYRQNAKSDGCNCLKGRIDQATKSRGRLPKAMCPIYLSPAEHSAVLGTVWNPRGKKRLSLCFWKKQENNLKHKNNQHVYHLQTVFTWLFSSVPHPGCVRKWDTITIILPMKRALELSTVTQLTYSSQDLNPGLFDSKSHVCALSLHHNM